MKGNREFSKFTNIDEVIKLGCGVLLPTVGAAHGGRTELSARRMAQINHRVDRLLGKKPVRL